MTSRARLARVDLVAAIAASPLACASTRAIERRADTRWAALLVLTAAGSCRSPGAGGARSPCAPGVLGVFVFEDVFVTVASSRSTPSSRRARWLIYGGGAYTDGPARAGRAGDRRRRRSGSIQATFGAGEASGDYVFPSRSSLVSGCRRAPCARRTRLTEELHEAALARRGGARGAGRARRSPSERRRIAREMHDVVAHRSA